MMNFYKISVLIIFVLLNLCVGFLFFSYIEKSEGEFYANDPHLHYGLIKAAIDGKNDPTSIVDRSYPVYTVFYRSSGRLFVVELCLILNIEIQKGMNFCIFIINFLLVSILFCLFGKYKVFGSISAVLFYFSSPFVGTRQLVFLPENFAVFFLLLSCLLFIRTNKIFLFVIAIVGLYAFHYKSIAMSLLSFVLIIPYFSNIKSIRLTKKNIIKLLFFGVVIISVILIFSPNFREMIYYFLFFSKGEGNPYSFSEQINIFYLPVVVITGTAGLFRQFRLKLPNMIILLISLYFTYIIFLPFFTYLLRERSVVFFSFILISSGVIFLFNRLNKLLKIMFISMVLLLTFINLNNLKIYAGVSRNDRLCVQEINERYKDGHIISMPPSQLFVYFNFSDWSYYDMSKFYNFSTLVEVYIFLQNTYPLDKQTYIFFSTSASNVLRSTIIQNIIKPYKIYTNNNCNIYLFKALD